MNLYISIIAGWFWLLENAYFGWNFLPKSPEEVICDGLVLLTLATAINKEKS